MTEQLVLTHAGHDDFRLDGRTREIGRAGIAEARRALAAAVLRAEVRATTQTTQTTRVTVAGPAHRIAA